MPALPALSDADADADADAVPPAALPPAAAHRWLPWPLPALACWLVAWLLLWLLLPAAPLLGWPAPAPWLAAAAAGVLLALVPRRCSGWRRVFMAAGFPVSAALSGAAALPAWAWLLPMALLLGAYPVRAWRDAPLFPTPADALDGLSALVPLAPGAPVLDVGCGLGHGLAALRRCWPQARIQGIEWSGLLCVAARLRCPWAGVRRGDMWAADWSGQALVYLFQRPESMARAWAKASGELAPGAWLVSLDFAVPGVAPSAVLQRPGRQTVWAYRVGGGAVPAQPPAVPADNSSNQQARPGLR